MKSKLLLCSAATVAALLVGCGDDRHSSPAPPTPPMPPTSQSQSVDTAQVLALAQKSSETSTPIPVNGGVLTFSDTSETSTAIAVSAM